MDPMFFFYLTGGAMFFLLVSLVLGHGHHVGHGHSWHAGHTAGHGGAAHSTAHGAGHHSPGRAGSHSGSSAAAEGKTGPGNMSIWSLQMLLLFIAGFGIGGYFASSSLLAWWTTLLMGTAGGLGLAGAGYFGINFFYRRQGDSNIESREYVGLSGIVVTSIAAGAVGQVRCQIGTSRDTFLARSAGGASIPINSVVRIVDMVGSTAIVEIADSPGQIDLPWRS